MSPLYDCFTPWLVLILIRDFSSKARFFLPKGDAEAFRRIKIRWNSWKSHPAVVGGYYGREEPCRAILLNIENLYNKCEGDTQSESERANVNSLYERKFSCYLHYFNAARWEKLIFSLRYCFKSASQFFSITIFRSCVSSIISYTMSGKLFQMQARKVQFSHR